MPVNHASEIQLWYQPRTIKKRASKFNQFLFNHKADLLALVFILVFLISGIVTLDQYGLTWDEGYGNLFFGERYFNFWISFNKNLMNFEDPTQVISHPLNLFLSPERNYPWDFPPFADTLSSACMYLFAYGLNWLGPVDAFHLFKVIFAAIFLWVLYRFVSKRLGTQAALFTIFFLGTFPRFWGDMHFNPKDIPETILYGLTILAYWSWFEKPTYKKSIVTGIIFGATLATKFNAVFLPITVILGFCPIGFSIPKVKEIFHHIKENWLHYLSMILSAVVFFILCWPYLYVQNSPFRAILNYFQLNLASGSGHPTTWNWEIPFLVIGTMPETMLIFLLLGLIFMWVQRKKQQSLSGQVLLVWLLLPILRTMPPGMTNFDGIRHFLEFLPAAAIIAAYGASALLTILQEKWPKWNKVASSILLVCLVANLAEIYIRYNPFQYIYYNQIVGGFAGARNIFGNDNTSDYWATSYRRGITWLNDHAAQNSTVYVPLAGWTIDIAGPLWIRPDLHILPYTADAEKVLATKNLYIMFITREAFYNDVTSACENLTPIYQIKLEGLPLLEICLINSE